MTNPRYTRRPGLTVLEVTMALTLVAAGLVAVVQVLAVVARHRLATDQLLAAQLEAANVQEYIAGLAYDEATADALAALRLSPEAAATLPGAKLQASVVDFADFPAGKRIVVEVTWPGAEASRSVELTSWKFAGAEGER